MNTDLSDRVQFASDFVSKEIGDPPKFGIVLGTGSGVIAAEINIQSQFDYCRIPQFPVSTALGHKGRMIYGILGGNPVIAMDGRFHLYEGHSVDEATLGIRVMRNLGVESLLITNAAGGLNPRFKSGDIMVIDSHIDLMCRTSRMSSRPTTHGRPTGQNDIYDCDFTATAIACARANDFCIHTGVYAALLGPNYETRAEYRMLRRIGADVAGMSTVPEVNVAATLQLRIMALSIVTNVAKPDVLESTSGQQVIDAAEIAAPRVSRLIKHIIASS